MSLSLEHRESVARVAHALARVIARKAVEADPKLRRLDGIGKASAIHTMALNMGPELLEEAEAAYEAAVSAFLAAEAAP